MSIGLTPGAAVTAGKNIASKVVPSTGGQRGKNTVKH